MKLLKLKYRSLLWSMLAIILLSACSSGEQAHAPNEREGSAATAVSTPLVYPATDFYEQAAGQPGGTLRVAAASDTGTFDVHAIAHGNVQWLGRLLYDCLVSQDEKGGISPWLAKSWEISPDGRIYTFHLRDDVTFSDGEAFNAEAVRLNLEHMRDPATRSPLAAAYIAPYVSGKVIDEFTFQATLREPYTPFLEVLAQSWLSMISPRQIRENPKSIVEHPVGSGPYVLERYARDQGAVFVKRPDYHWAPPLIRHAGAAYLDRIELSVVPESMVRYNALLAGQYDLVIDATAQNAAAIRAQPNLIFSSRIRKANPFRSITFNVEKFPFDDVRVRRALAHAVDRDGLARIVGFGEYKVKSDFLAATTRYYDPAFQDVLKYDTGTANRLLDESGWSERDARGYRVKEGRRLAATLLAYEYPGYPSSIAVAIQSDLKQVGFDLRIELLPLIQVAERRYAGEYEAMIGNVWHTNTPDGLYILYHSGEITSDKRIGQNISRLRAPLLDDALSEARRASDPATLQHLYSKAQQRLTELVPAIPAFENHHLTAYRKQVRGMVFDTSHNTPFFTSLWLDR